MIAHPLGPLGAVVAEAEVTPSEWFAALQGRAPLVLAPDCADGWFGGTPLVACDPTRTGCAPRDGERGLRAAAAALQAAFDAADPRLAVALLPYDGDCCWAEYRGGVVLARGGWRTWGTLDPADARELLRQAREAPSEEVALWDVRSDMGREAFVSAVRATHERIAAGDVYVLNLTRRIRAHAGCGPAGLFGTLMRDAPSSMASAWLTPQGTAIVSASTERFVRMIGHEVRIAPVKGTRPRDADPASDARRVDELAGSVKERAEHVMIVDLERNDLGRVCEPGSIRVDPLFEVQTTRHCHQMVSQVIGLLRADAAIGDLLAATFPCGSITGAPKLAAMTVIEQLEHSPRGAYTGSLLVALPGSLDSSVLIRTAELDPATGELQYGSGCGITIDSDPDDEWDESVLKTRPILGPTPAVPLRETCRVVRGVVPLWPYHRARLAAGGCGETMLAEADGLVSAAAAEWADAATHRARLTLVASPEGTVVVEVAQRLSSLDVVGGIVAARVDVPESPRLPAGAAKPADRGWWDAAHHAAERMGARQAVLVAADGCIIDGSTAALWIAEDGALITPPAGPAIASVSAQFVRDRALAAGIVTRTEPISWERFMAADEAFFTNAFGGAAAVRDRGGRLFELVRGFFGDVWA